MKQRHSSFSSLYSWLALPVLPALVCLTFLVSCLGIPDYEDTPPQLLTARVESGVSNRLYLTFDRSMVEQLPPAPAGFIVSNSSMSNPVLLVERNGKASQIVLTLATNLTGRDSVFLSYAGAPILYSEKGGILSPFTNQFVENRLAAASAPTLVSAVVKSGQPSTVYLTFNKEMTNQFPSLPAGFVINDGAANSITDLSRDANPFVLKLVLERAIDEGDNVTLSYQESAGLTSMDSGILANIQNRAVANNVGKIPAPEIVSAEVRSGYPNRVYVTFSKSLSNIDSLAAPAGFSVNDGSDNPVALLGQDSNPNVLVITVSRDIDVGDQVSLSYSGSPLLTSDDEGELGLFIGLPVANNIGAVPSPQLISAEIKPGNPQQVFLIFSKPMPNSLPPAPAGFAVDDSANNPVIAVARDANQYILVLTLDHAVNFGDTVFLHYQQSGGITSHDGGILGAINSATVNNNLTTDYPRLLGAEYSSPQLDRLYLTFDKPMMSSPPSGSCGFSFTGSTATVNTVSRDSNPCRLVLDLGSSLDTNHQIFLHYSDSGDILDNSGVSLPTTGPVLIEYGRTDGLVLWNKLGSIPEVQNSAFGPGLAFALDISVPGISGTYQFMPGKFGNAASIDDVYSNFARVHIIVLTNAGTVLDTERGTIEIWCLQMSKPVPIDHNPHRLFDGPYGLGSGLELYSFCDGGSNILYFTIGFGGTKTVLGNENFDCFNGKWTHVAGVWDRSGIKGGTETLQLYINAVKVASSTATSWGSSVGTLADIGGANDDLCAGAFWVDNLKIYTRAKTTFSLNME